MKFPLLSAVAFTSVIVLGACAADAPKTASPASAAASVEKLRTASGTFVGKSNHVTTGGASIARADGKWVVVLEDDFFFDGAPDPHVALGSNGYRKDASLALLESNNGQQVYEIPASLDVADFNEIWIWCDQFAVPLGVASLELL